MNPLERLLFCMETFIISRENSSHMWKGIREIHKRLIERELSVTQLCNDSIKIIDDTKHLNAFITVCKDGALDLARALDGQDDRPRRDQLFGVPISIKDSFCTSHTLTTCGSRMLHNFVPTYSATVVRKLTDLNCLVMGKTNMDEFAMGSSCTTSYFEHAANFWNSDRLQGKRPNESNSNDWFMAGGSSTGSAISVASGACFASLGTDTGGSTRQPASLNGIVGFKPTYGLISRFGLIPLAHSLDVVSLLARNVDDIELIFNRVIGQDENDLTTIDHRKKLEPARKLLTNRTSYSEKIRIGIPDEFIAHGNITADISQQFKETINQLTSKTLGSVQFEIKKIHLKHAKYATECYTIISSAEIASNMSCYDGVKYGLSLPLDETLTSSEFNRDEFYRANRDAGFGAEVKKRILLGNYFLLAGNRDKYLMQALKLRRLISDDFTKAFKEDEIDVILMPSTPSTSVSYAEWLNKQDSNKLFLEDYFLIPANMANLPSISLPNGVSATTGMPVGMQLVSNKFNDLDLLSVARFFEQNLFNSKWVERGH